MKNIFELFKFKKDGYAAKRSTVRRRFGKTNRTLAGYADTLTLTPERLEMYAKLNEPGPALDPDVESALQGLVDGEWKTLVVWRRTPKGELVEETLQDTQGHQEFDDER